MLRLRKLHLKLHIRRTARRERDEQVLSRGQVIVLFALSLTALIGIMGLAIDASYAWINEVRIQKAADAAALAGAVYLPYNTGPANNASVAEATQNGYTGGTGGVVVNANQDATYNYQQDVTISAPVPTFFMRLFGINSLTATRTAHAQYNLPLPMGSPLNVFGYPSATDQQGNALNYWAAIQGPCTLKVNGDPYATKDTTTASSDCSAASTSNNEYHSPATNDAGAYDYSIVVPTAGTLSIQLYDPEFCRRTGQGDDTGDTWFTNNSQFTTTFSLYNPSATPYDLSTYTLRTSVTYPGDGSISTSDGQSGKTHSCSSYYVHTDGTTGDYAAGGTGSVCYPAGGCGSANPWIQYTSFTAAAGTYRLNVQTSLIGTNPADGSNGYSVKATLNGGNTAQVYGGNVATQSTMSVYNNLQSGTSYIYLAQVSAKNAGKTLVIDLFDPGDLNGTGVMSFMMPSPDGSSYSAASFDWYNHGTSLINGTVGAVTSGVTSVTTASGGTSNFQGNWLVVTIQVPPTYTVTNTNGGWWKIKYVITGGAAHDRTTWNASILNAPVHLVP